MSGPRFRFPTFTRRAIAVALLVLLICFTLGAFAGRIRERNFISSVRQGEYVATFDISLVADELRNNNSLVPQSHFDNTTSEVSLAGNILLMILAVATVVGLFVLRALESKENRWPRTYAFLAQIFCLLTFLPIGALITLFARVSDGYRSFGENPAIFETNGRLVFVPTTGTYEAESWICRLASYAAEDGSSALLSGEQYTLRSVCRFTSGVRWWVILQTAVMIICGLVLWSLKSKARGEESKLLAICICGKHRRERQGGNAEEASQLGVPQPELSGLDRRHEVGSMGGGPMTELPTVERAVELMPPRRRVELPAGEVALEMPAGGRHSSMV